MKKIFLIIFILIPTLIFASPSSSISIPNSFTPNTTISSSAVNSNFNTVQTTYNAHTHTDITQVGAITSGTWQGNVVEKAYGGTGNANGIGLPAGAVFFMVTGSCPTGTTDVSSTYSNKFVRINATAGTTGGTDTHTHGGATASHTLTTAEIPAHAHDMKASTGSAAGPPWISTQGTGSANDIDIDSENAGGGTGHTHDISSADNVPAYVQMKACQID